MRFRMQAENYSSEFSLIQRGLTHCCRKHYWPQESQTEVDILGPVWALGYFPLPANTLEFFDGSNTLGVKQDVAVFIPPFALFTTRMQKGPLEWSAFFSDLTLPEDFPNSPVMLSWNPSWTFSSAESLFARIRDQRKTWQPFDPRQTGSRLALKTKQWIDQNFRTEAHFESLAFALNTSQTMIGREFRACYGLSPSQYRKKLRTTFAMLSLVLHGESVTEAGTKVGYSDLDHFTKQFRANLLALPSQFKPPQEFYADRAKTSSLIEKPREKLTGFDNL